MNQQPKPSIQVCQIIAGTLIMGVIMFAGFTIASYLNNPQQAGNDSTMLFVAACFTGGALIGRFAVLKASDRNMAGKIADREAEELVPEDVLGAYQTRLIISLAILEGAAFFCLVAFMVEHRWESFGLAMFLLLMMAVNFPTENKFRNWVRKITGQSAFAGDEER